MGRLYDSLKAMDRAVNGWIGYFKNLVWDYIPEPHIREMSPHPTRLRRGVMYMMYSVILLSEHMYYRTSSYIRSAFSFAPHFFKKVNVVSVTATKGRKAVPITPIQYITSGSPHSSQRISENTQNPFSTSALHDTSAEKNCNHIHTQEFRAKT